MRKITVGIRALRALSALMAAAVLAACAAAAFASPGVSPAPGWGGEISALRMIIPDEPVTSGDAELPDLPVAPAK